MPADPLPWSIAWARASTGPQGFYRSASGRAEAHFATNVSDGTVTADRIAEQARAGLEPLLARHGDVTVTDVGAGNGQLLGQLMSRLDEDVVARVHWRALDVRSRPTSTDPRIEWIAGDAVEVARSLAPSAGIVIAHELLDDIPCEVLEVDDSGRLRIVLVDPSQGREELGPVVDSDDWCDAWWPRREPAARIEVGRSRDLAWRAICGIVTDGLALAVDYGHTLEQRAAGLWDAGTLTSYRGGRLAAVIPDGTRNITAHVAMDACASAVTASATRLEQAGDGLWWLVHEMGR